jgi:hypothetical protein
MRRVALNPVRISSSYMGLLVSLTALALALSLPAGAADKSRIAGSAQAEIVCR